MIACPKCGSRTGVVESRGVGNFIRRRRICETVACGHRVTTVEITVERMRRLSDPIIVSRSALEAALGALSGVISDSVGRDHTLTSVTNALPILGPELDDD